MSKIAPAKNLLLKGILSIFLFFVLFPTLNTLSQGEKRVDEFIRNLHDKNPLVRWSAAEELGRIKDVRTVEPLIEALRDNDEEVRREVVRALGEIKDPRAVNPLGALLKDKDESVRINVLLALEKIGNDQAVELIISALKNDNPLVRMNASSSLGKIGDAKALDHLKEVAGSDPLSYVRSAAERAFTRITIKTMEESAETSRIRIEDVPPQQREPVIEEKTPELIAEMKKVAKRLEKNYGLVLNYMNYDIMDLLNIEARMKVKHPKDTMDILLHDLLTEEDKERNTYLF